MANRFWSWLKPKSEDGGSNPNLMPAPLSISLVVGIVIVLLFGLSGSIDAFAVVALASGAAFAFGALLGFLFGIPKYRRDDQGNVVVSNDTTKKNYAANTNLEEVSDWLTKIIVGIGLAQFGELLSFYDRIGSSLAPAFGGRASGVIFSQACILYFLLVGFLFSYLWTRTEFQKTLDGLGEIRAVREEVGKLASEFRELEDNKIASELFKELKRFGDAIKNNQRPDNKNVIMILRDSASKGLIKNPKNRKLSILFARITNEVMHEGEQDFIGLDEACRQLNRFVEAKLKDHEKDEDLAAGYYNIACYQALILRGMSSEDPAFLTHRTKFYSALKDCLAIRPQEASAAWADADLRHMKDDPEFKKATGQE